MGDTENLSQYRPLLLSRVRFAIFLTGDYHTVRQHDVVVVLHRCLCLGLRVRNILTQIIVVGFIKRKRSFLSG